MKYEHLLKPIQIGNHIVKNRIVYPNASPHFLQGPETFPAGSYRAFVSGLAKNGAGIVNVAEWANPNQRKGPSEADFTHMQNFDLTDPAVHNYFAQMAQEVHFYGSKIIVSINPFPMPDGYSLNGGRMPGPMDQGETQPIPTKLMPQAHEMLIEKTLFYKNLGFDGVAFRGDMFMTPVPGERRDAYGGSLENRTRFYREALKAVKDRFGGDIIIEVAIAWEQPDGYMMRMATGSGYSEEDAAAFIRMTEDFIDIYQIRENSGATSHPTGYNFKQGRHPALDFCTRMKQAGTKALLEPIGGFQSPHEIDKVIAEGKCDMIGMARGLLADYAYGEKAYAGRGEEIRPCLKCNKCHGTILLGDPDPWVSVCSVNPLMGFDGRLVRMLDRPQPAAKKKVAVIGGGCAGMYAAVVAAEQGHTVTLFEKTDKLGGQMLHADSFSFKWPIKNYKSWLIAELGRKGVKVVMDTEPSPEEINAAGFDAVIAALGAAPNLPDSIEGLKHADGTRKAGVRTCIDVFGKEAELGKHVVIVGGSETGVETAMYLCENGHDVTVLTRQGEPAHDASRLHYITMSWVRHYPDGSAAERPAWEMYENLQFILNATTKKVEGNTVTYKGKEGQGQTINADSIVICGGMKPLREEAMGFAGITEKYFAIGDCNKVGNIQNCTSEAYARAMIL